VKNSGTESTFPGTRDSVGQLLDCRGEFGMVGNPTFKDIATYSNANDIRFHSKD